MTTATVALEPQNIPAGVRSLKAEFASAALPGVQTTATQGAIHVKMTISRLPDYQFAYGHDYVSWRTPQKKIVVQVKGFAVEQRTENAMFHVVLRRVKAERDQKQTSAIRKIFFQRSLRAIEELQTMDEKKLAQAVQAPTDFSVLVAALNTEEALANIRTCDPLARARVRGFQAKRDLIEAEGGSLSSTEAAKLLQMTRQAIDKRRNEGRLLALELGRKGFRYPVWQFGLAGLEAVLEALRGRDPWEQVTFFLNPSPLLEDRTPLDVLREERDLDDVLRAASVYGRQGA
jgi:hypothetical protein